jgi:hypothetical protein
MRSADKNLIIQTICVHARQDRPAIGGLLLWKDKKNYLCLDLGRRGDREISFQGCLDNQDIILGRGLLPMDEDGEIYLRLERTGEGVSAFCSRNGENWYTVGFCYFQIKDPVQVGLHAIGMIPREIYCGAYPNGTAIRFGSFYLWEDDN